MKINRRYVRHCQDCDASFDNGNERGCEYHELVDDEAQRNHNARQYVPAPSPTGDPFYYAGWTAEIKDSK